MINNFKEKFYFLSNMYPCKINDGGLFFNSAEACFQSYKVKDKTIFTNINGYEARKLGRNIKIETQDWDNQRLKIMKHVLYLKFTQNPELKELLLKTKNEEICENNNWNDTFWGVCNGVGENNLGKLLMQLRHSFKKIAMIKGISFQKLPNKYVLNYGNETWQKVIKIFKEILIKNKISEAITGMSRGADTAFACAVLQLKKEGYEISLSCFLPDYNQTEQWDIYSKKIYQEILKRADNIIYQGINHSLFNYLNRNNNMIEIADIVLGFWDGFTDCEAEILIKKAQKNKKQILLLNPQNLKIINFFN